MAQLLIYNAALTTSYQASTPIVLAGDQISLDFAITVAAGADAAIQWYLEYTDNPVGSSAVWYRETAERLSATTGTVSMPLAVRTFLDEAGNALPAAASYLLNAQFIRKHKNYRVQIKASAGTVSAVQIYSNFGAAVNAPVTS